jgi:hypothetical protein
MGAGACVRGHGWGRRRLRGGGGRRHAGAGARPSPFPACTRCSWPLGAGRCAVVSWRPQRPWARHTARTCLRMDTKEGTRFLKGLGSTLISSCRPVSVAAMTDGSCVRRGGKVGQARRGGVGPRPPPGQVLDAAGLAAGGCAAGGPTRQGLPGRAGAGGAGTLSHSAALSALSTSTPASGPVCSGSRRWKCSSAMTAFLRTCSRGWRSEAVTAGYSAPTRSRLISLVTTVSALHTAWRGVAGPGRGTAAQCAAGCVAERLPARGKRQPPRPAACSAAAERHSPPAAPRQGHPPTTKLSLLRSVSSVLTSSSTRSLLMSRNWVSAR